MIQNGVKQIKRDHRNYSAHRTFGATLVFTDEYNVDAGLTMPNQNLDGYPNGCTGYSQAELCQDQDKKQYRPDFTYKKTLLMDNEQLGEPCDIRTSLKSTKVYGVLGVDESTDLEATKHLRGAYYQVENHSDWFDSIRSTITLNKGSVSVATQWFTSFEKPEQGILSETFSPDFSWHNYKVSGWKQINGQPYLIVKSWQGPNFADRGYCYMSRNTINRLLSVSGSGAFIVAQYDPSKIQTVKLDILSTILSYLVRLLSSFKKPAVVPAPPPVEDHYEEVKQAIQPKYLWDTKENIRHSVRVICDEEKLTTEQKNTMCATVQAESGFVLAAKHENYVGGNLSSTDWGICQWNDFYHGKEISPTEAVDNPEKAVRLMCAYWKRGQRNLWVAYSSGAYKKHL